MTRTGTGAPGTRHRPAAMAGRPLFAPADADPVAPAGRPAAGKSAGCRALFKPAVIFLAVLCLAPGCNRSAQPSPAAASERPLRADPNEPVKAQPKLRTLKLWLGSEELHAEIALTLEQVRTGMMFRTNMAETEAMLFVFARPHQAGFWMKNTYVPLSAAYLDPEGVILEIHDLEPRNTNTAFASTDRVQYVLETTQGWFNRHNISTGAVVRTELGSLRETFFTRK